MRYHFSHISVLQGLPLAVTLALAYAMIRCISLSFSSSSSSSLSPSPLSPSPLSLSLCLSHSCSPSPLHLYSFFLTPLTLSLSISLSLYSQIQNDERPKFGSTSCGVRDYGRGHGYLLRQNWYIQHLPLLHTRLTPHAYKLALTHTHHNAFNYGFFLLNSLFIHTLSPQVHSLRTK